MKNDNSFAVQDRLAGEYLSKKHQGKIYAVWKSTTAGVTTSLLKVGCEKKRKVILVSPTNKLLKKTKELVEGLLSFKPKIENISANKELCRQVKEEIKQYPNLEFLSSHRKHNCKGCQYNNPTDCLLQYILNNDFDVLGLTYAKLNTLIEVDEGYAKQLLNKLFAMDVLLLDEFTETTKNLPSLTLYDKGVMLEDKIVKKFSKYNKPPLGLETIFWESISLFLLQFKTPIKNEKKGRIKNKLYNLLPPDCKTLLTTYDMACLNYIKNLTKKIGGEANIIQEIYDMMGYDEFVIMSKKDKVDLKTSVTLTPIMDDPLTYLKKFVDRFYTKNKQIFIVDSRQPYIDWDNIVGKKVEHLVWGDPLKTNEQQLIICDTAHWGKDDFFKGFKEPKKKRKWLQREIKTFLNDIVKHFNEAVFVVTLNTPMDSVINVWKKQGEISKKIIITHQRSAITRGVRSVDEESGKEPRIMCLIGGSYIPKDAYYPSTYSIQKGYEKHPILSHVSKNVRSYFVFKHLRQDDINSAFINSIGRVKDPEGKKRSIVFALGMKEQEVEKLLKMSYPLVKTGDTTFTDMDIELPQPKITSTLTGKLYDDAITLAELWKNKEPVNMEDLPFVARIISKVRKDGNTPASRIFHKIVRIDNKIVQRWDTEQAIKYGNKYLDVFKKYTPMVKGKMRKGKRKYVFRRRATA